MAFKNVVDFVEQPTEYPTFAQAFTEIRQILEQRIMQRNSIPYAQVDTGWWIIEDGNPINWQSLVIRAHKEGLV